MKKLIILVGIDGQPSMKKVYSQMTSDSKLYLRRTPVEGQPYIRAYKNNSVEDFEVMKITHPNLENVKVIRWGNRIEITTNNESIVYNTSSSIGYSSNKCLARKLFIKNKVKTPQLYSDENPPQDFPVIARPSYHSKGQNFVVLSTKKEFFAHYDNHADWYYSEYIDKEKEFRVYVAHGKVLGVTEKPKPEDEEQLAWNQAINHDKWILLKWANYPLEVVKEACKAVKALGLDFGGVDVMLKDGKAYVLESNTAPTLSDSPIVSLKFAKYFDWLNRKDERRKHWDFTKYKDAKSFAWKEFQLLDTKQ